MTCGRSGGDRRGSGGLLEQRLEGAEGLARDVIDEEAADDWLGEPAEERDAEAEIVDDLDAGAVARGGEVPDDDHPLGPRAEVLKAELESLRIGLVGGGPSEGNAG